MTRARARKTIVMALALPLIVVGCGSSSKKTATGSTDAGAATTTAVGDAPTTTAAGGGYGYGGSSDSSTATTVATGGSTAGSTVSVADVAKVGKVLVAADGRTLYLFEKDKGTTSSCTGGCLTVWPPYTSANAPTAGAGVTASKLSTSTGAMPNQVTYNGHLLYYFAADKKAGDAKGVGIPEWYPVTAAGTSSE